LKFFDCPETEKNITFIAGNFIGEINSMVNESEYTTTLVAETDSTFYKIERTDLLGFLRRNPGLFLAFGDSKYII
jgi:CRP-like cAMP-binding protein